MTLQRNTDTTRTWTGCLLVHTSYKEVTWCLLLRTWKYKFTPWNGLLTDDALVYDIKRGIIWLNVILLFVLSGFVHIYLNPSSASPVYIRDTNVVIPLPPATLRVAGGRGMTTCVSRISRNSARPSTRTVLTANLDMFYLQFLRLSILANFSCPDGVIQNGQWDLTKSRSTSRVNPYGVHSVLLMCQGW